MTCVQNNPMTYMFRIISVEVFSTYLIQKLDVHDGTCAFHLMFLGHCMCNIFCLLTQPLALWSWQDASWFQKKICYIVLDNNNNNPEQWSKILISVCLVLVFIYILASIVAWLCLILSYKVTTHVFQTQSGLVGTNFFIISW